MTTKYTKKAATIAAMNQANKPLILVADDEPLYLQTTGELLEGEGFEVVCVEDAHAAVAQLKQRSFDLILSDLNMPGNLKLELLKEGRGNYAHIPLIVVTGVPSLPTAIESVRLGIADYLLKPVKFEDLLASVVRALRDSAPIAEVPQADAAELHARFPEIVGRSPLVTELLDVIDRLATSTVNVLLTGESGTGKEVVARAIHNQSPRRKHTFQVIDCTAIPETLFESMLFGHVKGSFTGAIKDQVGLLNRCHRGTAFFDELGELPVTSQAKLLRAIQEQTFTPVGETEPVKVDTRFICATNRDLQAEVDTGRFRSDLFYRLAVVHIELPPLRERGDDVILLAERFLRELQPITSKIERFSDETLAAFRRYRWPGNIRELRNVVERSIALARGNQIELNELPMPLRRIAADATGDDVGVLAEISRDEALDSADRAYLSALLEKHTGNIAAAARQAGLSRQGLSKLLKRHAIAADNFR